MSRARLIALTGLYLLVIGFVIGVCLDTSNPAIALVLGGAALGYMTALAILRRHTLHRRQDGPEGSATVSGATSEPTYRSR
jgi:ABC-type iron transport system FetAB permease component